MTCKQEYRQTCMHACMQVYVCMHTCRHACKHASTQARSTQACKHASIPRHTPSWMSPFGQDLRPTPSSQSPSHENGAATTHARHMCAGRSMPVAQGWLTCQRRKKRTEFHFFSLFFRSAHFLFYRFLDSFTTRDQQKLRPCLLVNSPVLPGPCADCLSAD